MKGLRPADDYESNGCTCSPDILFGTNLQPACHWHDYAYEMIGGDETDRYWADVEFLQNLKTCGLNRFAAHFYFYRVRLWGHTAFTYHEPIKKDLRFYLRLILSRYIEW